MRERLEAARLRHRAGDFAAARAAYESLRFELSSDADLLGLMAVLAMQEGELEEAESLFRLAMAPEAAETASASIRLRNLNNRFALLKQAGRREPALALAAEAATDWPEGQEPEASERQMLLSLSEALLTLDQAAKALRLVERSLPDAAHLAPALVGRIRLALGEDAAALPLLERAAADAPDDFATQGALSCVRGRLGGEPAKVAEVRRLMRAFPYLAAPPRPSQRATILILNEAPAFPEVPPVDPTGFHLHSNFGAQVGLAMADRYRCLSLFGYLPVEGTPWQAHRPQLVLNNLVNSEEMNAPGRLEMAEALVERVGLPVINRPRAVFATTRQKNAIRLQGIPGLVTPRVERYNTRRSSLDEIVADLETRFDYPVILRKTRAQMSSYSVLRDSNPTALLVADQAALRRHLEASGWREFYAVRYVDLGRPGGWFRKLRAVFIGGEIIVTGGGGFDQWMVSGWRYRQVGIDFYRAHPEVIPMIRRIVADPEGELGRPAMEALRAIRARLPLDLFGLDFDVDSEGRVVFFEATAAMNFLEKVAAPGETALPSEPFQRVREAFHALVDSRIGAA